jgi:para-aminobenzoate synthetase component 1
VSAGLRFRPRAFELGDVELWSALLRLEAHRQPILLDSAQGATARWSVLGIDPLACELPQSVLAPRAALAQWGVESGDALPGPFHGGFLGALAYDLGVHGERPVCTAPEPFGFPGVVGGLYCDFLVRDERARATWLVLGDEPGDGRDGVGARRECILGELGRPRAAHEFESSAPRRATSPELHGERIERCRRAIARGDIYQANLAHRFTCAVRGSPFELYRRLRLVNPAPYMGCVRWSGGTLLSASPELLLESDGVRARTRPIKGTAPRSADPDEDARNAAELLASAKDRAELAMIVDLERNDLGRVARPGRVWVEQFPRLESYARVHHTTADVVAELRPGSDACDALASLFPGGSVTGAPKLRAMELIAELEGHGRGFFCGALGFVDTRGHARFNILIRTLLHRPLAGGSADSGEAAFSVGGGITWSSSAADEDRETLHKAAGLVAALEFAPNVAPSAPGR